MTDRRVPGMGNRRPVLLSSVAVDDLRNLEVQTSTSLTADLKRLANGSVKGKDLVIGPPGGEQGYKYIEAGDIRAVYREMSPAELVRQGYSERLARDGGIFVVDIIPIDEYRERS